MVAPRTAAAAVRSAKLHSNCYHQQTNTQVLQAGCPSCHPTNSVRALKENITFHGLDHSKPMVGGPPTLSLITKGSRLPWGALPSLSSAL